MVYVRIICHADLQALQDRSDSNMVLKLVCLESVRIASDAYALLRGLIERKSRRSYQVNNMAECRYWSCSEMDLLSLVAGVALEFHKIKHDLYPLLAVQEAKLEGEFLKALLLLKSSAVALVRLTKDAKELIEPYVKEASDVEDVLLGKVGKVEEVGKVVKDTAHLVLKGTHDIAWLQLRLPSVLEVVDVLLSTPVLFPDGYHGYN